MPCFFCKGAMNPDITTHFAQVGSCFVIVKGVPCSKCEQCGETSFSGTVVKRLEQIIAELKKSLTEITVVDYSAA